MTRQTMQQSSGEAITVHSYSDYRNTVIVPNQTAQNSALSWAARGLLVFMLSMPPEWRFRESDLIQRSPMGRDHLRSVVRELEAHRYLARRPLYDAQHRKTGSLWEVWAHPLENPPGPAAATPENPLTGNPSVDPLTENPSVAKPQSWQGFYPPTENPSLDPEPPTGFPPTENPSVYKNLIEETKQNPPSPSLRSGDRPPTGGSTHADRRPGGDQASERHLDPFPGANITPEAARSAGKAPQAASATTDTTRPPRGASEGRRAASSKQRALPEFAEPVRHLLEAWWRLRKTRHRASASNALTPLSVRALTYANDLGVLVQFAEHAAEHGWLSLGFKGHRGYIDELAAEFSPDKLSQRSDSCMLRARSGFRATSRQSAAADRAIAMFTEPNEHPLHAQTCSTPELSLTSSLA